jgi:Zn-dependent protease with chaperone function
MTYALHHAVLVIACPLVVPLLAHARWLRRVPHTAVLLWQALGLAWALSVLGLAFALGLAPYRLGVLPGLARAAADLTAGRLADRLIPIQLGALGAGLALTAMLVGALVTCALEVLRARRRHRRLLALVARLRPEAPGALVLEHPAAAAYCLPGMRSQVVVSEGMLKLLDRDQLAAVLAHEHAHARARHDLVLLPFVALRRVLPRLRLVAQAADAVALLVEMCADDRACRRHAVRSLATALLRVGTASGTAVPAGALGAATSPLAARVQRLLAPQPRIPWAVGGLAAAAAATVLATPLSLLVLPT